MSLEIAHLSSELSGGAGIAAERLHDGLRREGISSRLYYAKGEPRTADCVALYPKSRFGFDALAEWVSELQAPRHVPGVYFTRPTWYRGPRWERFAPVPQVLHLHWISRWLDQPRLFRSLPRDLPVIWSLHDLNPLTGGCHLPGDCDRFTRECGECPQLRRPGRHDRAQRIFALKDDCYAGLNLHVVGNSEWTTTQARRSLLLRHARSFQTIHLGLDPDVYHPVDRAAARLALGLSPDGFVAGMGCANLATANKGAVRLVQALEGLGGNDEVTLIAFGDGHLPSAGPGMQTREFGYLASPERQSAFYSACDVFVVPSLVESFGLTALEAAACGTPVLAYRTGGLPEVVVDGTTGMLVGDVGSVDALREGLRWLKAHPERRREMGRAARARVEQHFTLAGMARAYAALYRRART